PTPTRPSSVWSSTMTWPLDSTAPRQTTNGCRKRAVTGMASRPMTRTAEALVAAPVHRRERVRSRRLTHLVERHPFIARVALRKVARAVHDARDTSLVEIRRVAHRTERLQATTLGEARVERRILVRSLEHLVKR